ncbi:MAG: energy-coupled thiamine transporter ThiT [Eubacteriales bacterium]
MKNRLQTLVLCAMMLALAFVLSLFKFDAPFRLGGSVTACSMLPLLVVAAKYGYKWGVPTAFLYALIQLLQGVVEGDVFVWLETGGAVLLCVLFDYLVPFTVLGLGGFLRKRGRLGIYIGMATVMAARFVSHFITGVVIWGQWAEGSSPFIYSLLYNGGYMLPEIILTVAAAAVLFESRVLNIGEKTAS